MLREYEYEYEKTIWFPNSYVFDDHSYTSTRVENFVLTVFFILFIQALRYEIKKFEGGRL